MSAFGAGVSGSGSDRSRTEPGGAPGLAQLRARLAAGTPAPAEGDEGHATLERQRIPAAVLLGIVERPHGPQILLTRRTAHLTAHAGQISLPGGRIEAGDVDPVAAALRESQEEIGLDPARVELLGELSSYDTMTGYRIHPIVGWIRPPLDLVPDPYEVAELFELPLAFALDPANHERDSYERDGRTRQFWVLRWGGHYIWGATAGILVGFARRIGR